MTRKKFDEVPYEHRGQLEWHSILHCRSLTGQWTSQISQTEVLLVRPSFSLSLSPFSYVMVGLGLGFYIYIVDFLFTTLVEKSETIFGTKLITLDIGGGDSNSDLKGRKTKQAANSVQGQRKF